MKTDHRLPNAAPLPSSAIQGKVAEYLPWATDAIWQPMHGGRTNVSWRISNSDTDDVILKLYQLRDANPLFPNDPSSEETLLKHLDRYEIAPSFIARFACDDLQCGLYHALPGDTWNGGLEDVAGLINRLHTIPPPLRLRRIEGGSHALKAQALAIQERAGRSIELPMHLDAISVPDIDQTVLLHCDMVPGNLIQGPKGLKLIDWQCPAIGDPTEDMAIFLSPAMQLLYRGTQLTTDELDEFLGAFTHEKRQRYLALAALYHFRMASYCLWQVSRGRREYQIGLDAELSALHATNATS